MENTIGTLPKVKTLKVNKIDGNWVVGTFKGYKFEAKIFSVRSVFGINEGRISKLMIIDQNGEWLFNYDRGMDVDHVLGHEFAELFK